MVHPRSHSRLVGRAWVQTPGILAPEPKFSATVLYCTMPRKHGAQVRGHSVQGVQIGTSGALVSSNIHPTSIFYLPGSARPWGDRNKTVTVLAMRMLGSRGGKRRRITEVRLGFWLVPGLGSLPGGIKVRWRKSPGARRSQFPAVPGAEHGGSQSWRRRWVGPFLPALPGQPEDFEIDPQSNRKCCSSTGT